MCFEAKLTSAINLIYFGAKTKPGSEWSFHKKFSESGGTTFRHSASDCRKVVPPESKNLCVERSVNLSEPDFHIFDKKRFKKNLDGKKRKPTNGKWVISSLSKEQIIELTAIVEFLGIP